MNRTKIEWVKNDDGRQGYTWNPVTGCFHGCSYCYARRFVERFAKRLPADEMLTRDQAQDWHHPGNVHTALPGEQYPAGFGPTFWPHRILEPQSLRKPRTIFVCSMADLLGDWVPAIWIQAVIAVMRLNDRHRYLLLTKNPRRYAEFSWPENCWLGTTYEDQEKARERIPHLLAASAAHRFVSLEPLLGPVDLDTQLSTIACDGCGCPLDREGEHHEILHHVEDRFPELCGTGRRTVGLDWVITGAQTGPKATSPDPAWVDSLIDQCRAAGVPIFLKDNLRWGKGIQEVPWL